MNELELKYGCNPNQKPARIFMTEGRDLPLEVLNGRPGYINFLDALNSWQLVKALKKATGLPAAASFKHVSPAGAALGLPLSEVERQIYLAPEGELSPIACAYLRARGADRLCSFGDWAALSDTCDAQTAQCLAQEVSDGVIAPDYTDEALAILKTKRKGGYNVVKIDPGYQPDPIERRSIFGITFEQGYNSLAITGDMLTTTGWSWNPEKTMAIARIIRNGGVTLPSVATMLPFVPLRRYPTKMEMFTARRPGAD